MKTIEKWIASNCEQLEGYWIAMDEDGTWALYDAKPIITPSSFQVDYEDNYLVLDNIEPVKDWTKSCQQIKKPVNPNEWIEKLCLFWNDENYKQIGILRAYVERLESPFILMCTSYMHCRPLTKDEALALVVGE